LDRVVADISDLVDDGSSKKSANVNDEVDKLEEFTISSKSRTTTPELRSIDSNERRLGRVVSGMYTFDTRELLKGSGMTESFDISAIKCSAKEESNLTENGKLI